MLRGSFLLLGIFGSYAPFLLYQISLSVTLAHQKVCGILLLAKIAPSVKIQYLGVIITLFAKLFYYFYGHLCPSLQLKDTKSAVPYSGQRFFCRGSDIPDIQGAQGVEHGKNHNSHVGKHRKRHTRQSQRGQNKTAALDAQRKNDVLAHDAHDLF